MTDPNPYDVYPTAIEHEVAIPDLLRGALDNARVVPGGPGWEDSLQRMQEAMGKMPDGMNPKEFTLGVARYAASIINALATMYGIDPFTAIADAEGARYRFRTEQR